MNDSTLRIEALFDNFVILIVATFKFAKDRIGNEVCELDEPRSSRIHENRHFGKVSGNPESMPGIFKLARQRLNTAFR